MLALLAGTGIYLSIRLHWLQFRRLGYGVKQLFKGGSNRAAGDIPPAQALMTSLAATVGTGNIVGVATAIALGGPGALFWMWMIAILGMATKYAEAVLAVHFRETDGLGNHVGGPMYYIENGLGKNWKWLAIAFAFFGMIAGFGIGNGVQANAVADAINTLAPTVDRKLIGAGMTILVGLVILGGIKRIGKVASTVVPFMAGIYLLAGL